MLFTLGSLPLAALFSTASAALSVTTDTATIASAGTLASELKSRYPTTNGLLGQPYPSWISASLLDTQLRHWHYTGDDQYNSNIASAITTNAGRTGDFLAPSITGNDDQLWWALTAMSAAEYQLPSTTGTSWLQLATTVFDQVTTRWDASTCGGGIRWQISPSSPGYNYKNAISNGLAFQLAARLARHTNNATYTTWATKIFSWTRSIGLIDIKSYAVYDGSDSSLDCAQLDHTLWTYNVGVFLYGAAVMLALTDTSSGWQAHVEGFLQAAIRDFTTSSILREDCEASTATPCDTDQFTFKAHLAAWLGLTAGLVQEQTAQKISTILDASSQGALASCEDGTCGTQWTIGRFDGVAGVGQDMGALEVVQALLAPKAANASSGEDAANESKAGLDNTAADGAAPREGTAAETQHRNDAEGFSR